MKDTIYFRHDYDAHADPKIVKLRMKFGWEGYGIFWAILETMRSDADIVMNLCDVDANAYRLHCDSKLLRDILLYLVDIGLLIEDGGAYYSERLQEDVEYMREKSNKARKSADARWKKRDKNANALQTQSKGNAIKDSKVKEIKEYKLIYNIQDFVDQRNSIKELRQNGKTVRGLPKTIKITDRLQKARYKVTKEYTEEEIKNATNKYIEKIEKTIPNEKRDGTHRYSLFEFITRDKGLQNYINS